MNDHISKHAAVCSQFPSCRATPTPAKSVRQGVKLIIIYKFIIRFLSQHPIFAGTFRWKGKLQ